MKKSFVAKIGAQTEEITIERALRGATEVMEANALISTAIDLIKRSADPTYQKEIIIPASFDKQHINLFLER